MDYFPNRRKIFPFKFLWKHTDLDIIKIMFYKTDNLAKPDTHGKQKKPFITYFSCHRYTLLCEAQPSNPETTT